MVITSNRAIRRPLVRVLCCVVGLELAFLGGRYLGSLWPRAAQGERRPAMSAALLRWRQSTQHPADDPAVGHRAPRLELKDEAGATVSLAAGRRRVVIFVRDGSG